ncbi:ABC transporter ATP-binding protein [Ruoffia tabacinasalis]|jgi:osmoprotectant transport system ATP-binding protein|uniref:ABC transporter ATP-binding protein n=1 Tax=Ruoffia tabacinasalis TaxID=87458 RepID=A0ABS0LHF5_9LACT|nr:ABC transporter ATP-binding protein [Ruoffia tabacinasalis]MBG9977663.1 ABC transporter ATP-binding protein [Ruoffia tabacinasalis]
MAKTKIKFRNINKSFGDKEIIKDLSFDIEEGQFITILGSSGSGKTTTLKMVNRLIEPNSGQIEINDKEIKEYDLIELRRKIGYVVQQIGLFPHITIEKNIATVPELLGWEPEKIKERVTELMALIQLPYSEYANRYPKQLSGGQQQRIGVARALAANPQIMLLDEPFGSVDAITRKELQTQIKAIHAELDSKTFLFVTHDINEAFLLGDRVMIMDKGRIEQYDTPQNIIKNPKGAFVNSLLDTVREEESLWSELI